MRPVHPGEILRGELDELGLSANALAKALAVPTNRITAILKGQRGLTADTALRLSRYFGTTPQFWLNLQKTFELRVAELSSGQDIAEASPASSAGLGSPVARAARNPLPVLLSQRAPRATVAPARSWKQSRHEPVNAPTHGRILARNASSSVRTLLYHQRPFGRWPTSGGTRCVSRELCIDQQSAVPKRYAKRSNSCEANVPFIED